MGLKNLILGQKPLTVSLLSFLLMLLVVMVIGLWGGRHIIGYLEQQLVKHGIEHNLEVIAGIRPLLEKGLHDREPREGIIKRFQQFVEHVQPFGVRLFLVDDQRQLILADSAVPSQELPYAARLLLDTPVQRFDGSIIDTSKPWQGNAWRERQDGAIELLSLQALEHNSVKWTLGVSSNISELLAFMSELHLHLDTVLLLTYSLIGLLGFLLLRWVGRYYEASLERKVAERSLQLEQAQDRLIEQARLATIGQTASVLAHEMRNPLASIKLALSGIKRGSLLDGRQEQRLNLVLGEVDRLESMLNDTLDYVRPVTFDEQPVHLDELLDEILSLEQALFEQKQLQLARQRCRRCPAICMDSQKMRQVILNLLRNASEASPERGAIGIKLATEGEGILLQVSNSGTPMSDEVKAHAFEFFFTTKAKGTGLGLGLVKRVVEEHGGHVSLRSSHDETVFSIWLPQAPAALDNESGCTPRALNNCK